MGRKSRKKQQRRKPAPVRDKAEVREEPASREALPTINKGNMLKIASAAILIFIVAFMVYFNVLKGDFIWDDEYLILNNSQIKTFAHLPNVFRTYVGYGSENINNFYRPVQEISNMIDWFLWGRVSFGFHLTNNILHALVAVLIFIFLFYLAGDIFIAGLAALFWAVHPVHTEAIAYIAGRADPLYSLFMLLSLILFIVYVNGVEKGRKTTGAYFFSIIAFVLSLLSKEIILTMPLLVFLYALYFVKGRGRAGIFRKIRWHWVPYAGIVFVYGYLRTSVLDFSDIAPASVFVKIPLFYRLLTFFRTVVVYFKLLVMPVGLHMERTMPISRNLFEHGGWLAVLLIAGLIWAAVKMFRKNKLISFGIAWFFANLLPVSNIIPINSFLAEHWIYMASIGPFLIFSVGAVHVYRNKIPSKLYARAVFILLLAVFLSLYARATVERNKDWLTEKAFFNSTLKYHPRNARLYLNLGNTYYENKDLDKAIENYEKAIEINKNYAVAYGNIASAHLHRGNLPEAEEYIIKALNMKYNYPIAHYNLGIILFKKGQFEEAIKELKIATEQLPQLFQAWNMMGRAYLKTGKVLKAKEAFENSLKIMPSQPNIRNVVSRINRDITSGKIKRE
ncbi:MAG: tetratricopeptide repeat protein [Candidatus Omnitrophica bacterium]|nr:tetratricopeptide repeat protein [Candidatus Omnitrophota bacterium]